MRHYELIQTFFNKWIFDLKFASGINVPENISILPSIALITLIANLPMFGVSYLKMS